MRAAVLHAFGEPLVIEELELDPPGPGEVGVRVAAVAVCHSDIHAGDGAWGGRLPVVNGHEASGVVAELGAGVTSVAVGDHVIVTLIRTCGSCHYCERGESHLCGGDFELARQSRLRNADGAPVSQGIFVGGLAEEVVVHSSQVAPIPSTIPLDAASLLACGVITGYGAVTNTAGVPSGSSVVVIGVGGVGLNSVQGARAAGAAPIIAVDLSAAKLEAARLFGATDGVDATEPDPASAVRALTGGRGADYVFVTVGSAAAVEQGLTMLGPGGTLVIVGITELGAHARIDTAGFAVGSYRVLGSRMGSTVLARDIPDLVARYQAGELLLDELISDRFRLEDINEAIDSVRRGEALRNVVVFDGVGT